MSTDSTTVAPGEAPASPPYRYDAALATAIERRWQDRWEAEGTFHAPNPGQPGSEKPKAYVMDMFPYPSGSGLHVGHPLGFIGTDVLGRYLRMTGHNVLHPMGFDSFGLPAEQYAVQTGTHPRVTTDANIAWTKDTFAALSEHFGGGRWLNYLGDDQDGAIRSAYGPNYDRLVDVKRQYDPENVFHLNHNIVP